MLFSNNRLGKNLVYFLLGIAFEIKPQRETSSLGPVLALQFTPADSSESPTHMHLVLDKISLHSVLD